MYFEDLFARNGGFWGQNGERVVRCLPQRTPFLVLEIFTSVPILVKIHQETRA